MSQITLIRHGQANHGARDEAGYDKLSPLGHDQARWLGEHLAQTGVVYSRVYCGTLRRHIETARSMGCDNVIQDARLNELEYFAMSQLLQDQTGLQMPLAREEFVAHLPKVFEAWSNGTISGCSETFDQFETRLHDVMTDIAAGDGPALVISSGGAIANIMKQTLDLNLTGMSKMALAIMNTSIHRLFPIGGHLSPVLFNAVPHLDTPDRQFAQTHV
jgi:broad specificity phosphatase PhoE